MRGGLSTHSFLVMVVGRGLQGVGLGLLPVTMSIARSQLAPEKAGRAIASLSVTAAVGAGLGYPITGLIAQVLNFRAVSWFAPAITVALALALVGAWSCPATATRRTHATVRPVGHGALGLAGGRDLGRPQRGGGVGLGDRALSSLGIVTGCDPFGCGYGCASELRFPEPLIDVRPGACNRSVPTADVSPASSSAVAMYMFPLIIIEFK